MLYRFRYLAPTYFADNLFTYKSRQCEKFLADICNSALLKALEINLVRARSLPFVDIFYLKNIDKKGTFLDTYLPPQHPGKSVSITWTTMGLATYKIRKSLLAACIKK